MHSAKSLAARGCEVVMACRNKEKAEEAAREVGIEGGAYRVM
ncbi:MAG: protochlorophyllide oxidoreductase, partial [Cyanobacteria bacterium P01_E01_bin.6]